MDEDGNFNIVEIYNIKINSICNISDLFNPSNLKYVWKRSEEEEVVNIEKETTLPTYIRITSYSAPTYWYADKIGKVYKVKGIRNNDATWYDLGTS